jgi:excisionase family DNA binding protein
MTDLAPLAISIAEAVRIVGLGRTSLYAAIAAGKLKTRKSGRRTLVETAALRRFLEELPTSDRPSNAA